MTSPLSDYALGSSLCFFHSLFGWDYWICFAWGQRLRVIGSLGVCQRVWLLPCTSRGTPATCALVLCPRIKVDCSPCWFPPISFPYIRLACPITCGRVVLFWSSFLLSSAIRSLPCYLVVPRWTPCTGSLWFCLASSLMGIAVCWVPGICTNWIRTVPSSQALCVPIAV